ncbi:helix-turn-helix transcriptional regulator [Candidatus Marsarchaeota archaeon]|nr:helix-turn-helix transcriptional regulator [Candidatus Marsarchaeota archaeon]MCL5404725.1 helix-turn-helix transcriptional regulator [Candidatus Marsarchaeota archaeon]
MKNSGACAAQEALSLVSKKWLLIALNSIAVYGPSRYNQLLERLSPISPKGLADVLKLMESNGLIRKDNDSVHYVITAKGSDLDRAALPLLKWSRPFCRDKNCSVAVEMDGQLSRSR